MSRVITFSTKFPAYHPRKGEPTQFVEKIWKSLGGVASQYTNLFIENDIKKSIVWGYQMVDGVKYHTIRAGNRWKVGDTFSPRIWSGKPYNSKQLQFAPDLEIKQTWDFEIKDRGYLVRDELISRDDLERVAQNDGLNWVDLQAWFKYPKPFTGQIICWNGSVDYNPYL